MRHTEPFARRLLKKFFQTSAAVACLAAFATTARSQAPPPAPRVFVDCDVCEADYLAERLAFVTLVRDRTAAEVHVLVTNLGTASGGRAYTIALTGVARGRRA